MSGPILLVLRLLLILVLYAFLAFAIYTLWKDLRQRVKKPVATPIQPITLIGGERDGDLNTYQFAVEAITIGRDPMSELYLNDSTISAQHCKLTYHHGQWWVEDLKSTNGTYLNQEFVSEPFVVTDGDSLRCGRLYFTISIAGELEPR